MIEIDVLDVSALFSLILLALWFGTIVAVREAWATVRDLRRRVAALECDRDARALAVPDSFDVDLGVVGLEASAVSLDFMGVSRDLDVDVPAADDGPAPHQTAAVIPFDGDRGRDGRDRGC